jgi:hypothetical protein
VAARSADIVEDRLPDFGGHLLELFVAELMKIGGLNHLRKKTVGLLHKVYAALTKDTAERSKPLFGNLEMGKSGQETKPSGNASWV